MKKISIILGLAAAVIGLNSCSEDRGPKYHNPTEFVLNVPALQSQYIDLAEGNTLSLVTSQPNYGYAARANYSALMSLTRDFENSYALTAINNHSAAFNIKQADVSIGVCELLGIEDEDSYRQKFPEGFTYMPIYFKAVCQLSGVDGSLIESNVVSYDYIKPYLAVASPGYIYLVGTPTGWRDPVENNADFYRDWRLSEPNTKVGIGSKVYTGVFTLPGDPGFRFYTELSGWDKTSYGSQKADNYVDYPWDGKGSWSGTMGGPEWKGSYHFANLPAGEYTIVVNMADENNMTVKIYEGVYVEATEVYMVGNNAGWAEPSVSNQDIYNNWVLKDEDGSGVFSATFDFTGITDFGNDGDKLYCRFYKLLAGWGATQWASENDGLQVSLGVAYPTVVGEGTFMVSSVPGHKLYVELDTNVDEVTFNYAD